jgi:hypothetical protein
VAKGCACGPKAFGDALQAALEAPGDVFEALCGEGMAPPLAAVRVATWHREITGELPQLGEE